MIPQSFDFLPATFHFLRPAWLLALLPAAIVLLTAGRSAVQASAWRRLVDAHLLRHLLVGEAGVARRWPLWVLGLAWAAASLALAGPAWERIPQPTYTAKQPTVVALDLSPSMDADDLAPSRLARARHKLHDVLERRRGGQVALVLYSDDAFVAAPLTDDGRVIEEMIPSLTPGLMPGRQSHPERAIARANALLDQAGAPSGSVLLLTASAGDDAPAALAAARDTAVRGRELVVLGMGTEQGVPARDARGRVVKNADGEPVLARVDRAALEALAAAGGGRVALATADDGDLARLLAGRQASSLFTQREKTSAQADVWRDAGVWLLAVPLLLAPLAFRRGWLVGLAVAALLRAGSPANAATAPATSSWDDLWHTRDQQGQAALAAGNAAAAAELFEDPSWKAAAQYEGGRYDVAVEAYARLEGGESRYNLGNALARAGQLEKAIAAYDETLKERPRHDDAKFNRDLVQRLLDEQRRQQKQEQEQQKQEQSQSGQGQKDQPQSGGQPGDQQQKDRQDDRRQGQQGGQPQEQTGDADERNAGGSGTRDQQAQDSQSGQGSGEDREQQAEAAPGGSAEDRTGPAGAEQAKQEEQKERQASAGGAGEAEQAAAEKSAEPATGHPGTADAGEHDDTRTGGAPAGGSQDEPAAESRAAAKRDDRAERDDALARKMDDALSGDPAAPIEHDAKEQDQAREQAQAAPNGAGSAEHRPTTEQQQAREQKLRRVPDDPGGLLRARIRRHFAEQRLSKQEGTNPW